MERGRILIVEDEQLLALDLKGELESRGHVVTGVAGTGESALAAFQPDLVDLALLDINLPGTCDGISVANELRSRAPNLPIVFLTAYADPKFVERASISSPDGYIVKPYQPSELDAAISIALFKKRNARQAGEKKARTLDRDISTREGVMPGDPAWEVFDAFSRFPILSALEPNLQRQLALNTEIISLAKHASFFLEGDNICRPFALLEGKIALFKTSISGKELYTDIVFPGDPLGLLPIEDQQPSAFSARAQIPSKVLALPRPLLKTFLNDCERFRKEFHEFLNRRLRTATEMTRSLAHDRVEQRIAGLVLSIIERLSVTTKDARPIGVSLTRNEIASMCGCTIETAIRVTRLMEEAGLVDLSHRRRIDVLDSARLLSVARGELPLN